MSQQRKANETLRRGRVENCRYSSVDKNVVDYLYCVATSDGTGDFREQAIAAIENLNKVLTLENAEDGLVKLNVFLRNVGDKELARSAIRSFWNDAVPATTFIPQRPCDERQLLILEATAIKSGVCRSSDGAEKSCSCASVDSIGPRVDRRDEHAVLVEYSDVLLGFFGGFAPNPDPVGAYARSFDAFVKMRAGVENNGFRTPQIFRTWIYQGNIVLPEGNSQRYKELNRARSDFFYGTRFLERFIPKNVPVGAIYPASTGIGADDSDVALSCQAIQTERDDVVVVPLENPNQTPAFDYAEFYSPKSPKFSRAVAVSFNERCAVYVSGTASIVDQETVFIGDPAGQANQTLDNIEALISGSNLKKYGVSGFEADLSDLAVARVYVKRPEYYNAVREVCERRLANVPVVYTFADVCRDDLLVEIEGIVACDPKKKDN